MHTHEKDIIETDEQVREKAKNLVVEEIKKDKPKKDEGFWKFTIVMLLIFLGIRFYVAEPFLVDGASMDPNFATNDYLIVDELTYKFQEPQRGDVVVLVPPIDASKYFIKRIVGLPGERIVIEKGQTHVYNKEHPEGFVLDEPYVKFNSDKTKDETLSDTEYFVMGDNRSVSFDSRSWGALPRKEITGRAFLRLYPFAKIGLFPGGLDVFDKKQ
ncbi:MAG: signal peptidase I [bacterium]